MAAIDLVRRLLGGDRDGAPNDEDAATDPEMPLDAASQPSEENLEPRAPAAACPSCGYLIDPPPARNRRCPACREPIVVRQVDGRSAYLTEAAVAVFVAERERESAEAARNAERERWLRLASTVGVGPAQRAKLEAAPPTERTVEATRELYTKAAEKAVRTARREKRWADVARIRRAGAAASYAVAGAPVPPPDEIAALHREGMQAVLRSFQAQGTPAAELVSATCCKACRADDGKVFRIADELREPRLPHEGCPKGLCGCDWWIGTIERKRRRRPPARPPGI